MLAGLSPSNRLNRHRGKRLLGGNNRANLNLTIKYISKLTYSTLGKGKSSSKVPKGKNVLLPWEKKKVVLESLIELFLFRTRNSMKSREDSHLDAQRNLQEVRIIWFGRIHS